MTKKILGLDLGTNSIGWALIEQDFENKQGRIIGMGSRIIPMSQEILGDFGKGNSISQTAERTKLRSARRLRERHLLRRERLHRVLNILGFLPEHYANQIDFEKRLGKFKNDAEPKLAYNDAGFIFKVSFEEMLNDFREHQPEILLNEKGEPKLVPYDWAIYYLRKKALTQKINKEELAWIVLNFNQKRGYYQLRGEEEEENPNKLVEFYSLKIIDVVADDSPKGKSDGWYSLYLENNWVYRRQSKTPLFDWKGKTRDFIVTTELNSDGTIKTDKEGSEKRSFRAPGEDDWNLLKKKTEQEIETAKKTVGAYIYDTLLQNPKQKIKGKLVRTIERKFYREELKQILDTQIKLQPELFNEDQYNACVRELYRNNEAQQISLSKQDFAYLFVNDIIFYQRPLRSQKSSISNCTLEWRVYKDEKGVTRRQYLKGIPKSSPYYQEFRIWQWMFNLSIYRKDDDSNVNADFLGSMDDRENLFHFLNSRKEVDQKSLLKHLLEKKGLKGKTLTAEVEKYRWNYVAEKTYPCNQTVISIQTRLDKLSDISKIFLTKEKAQALWHLIYSVTDKVEYEKALASFAKKHSIDEQSFVEAFRKFPPFKSEYGSFSEKAIKKILPLMRLGTCWDWGAIDKKTQKRIDDILNGETNDEINPLVREKIAQQRFNHHRDFQGLPLWLSQYIIYNRHAEAATPGKWNSVEDLEAYLKEFKQHSLRNPIVEQVMTETLRVVKDIWVTYGNGARNFVDEIHIELGREMKNTAEDRAAISKRIGENETTNLRIKALLVELQNDPDVENVRAFSPMQQELLKIYEEGALNSDAPIDDDILKISTTAQPSSSELRRYKLWMEQKYRSPYTGEMIPLNKLFTPNYEIEHIIPQSRYFDDSLSNKVICEAAVNKLKDNKLALEFIKDPGMRTVEIAGKPVHIFDEHAYRKFVADNYSKNRTKRNKLLMEEIPEQMIERQLNDTRYISKFISNLLSNIVRSDSNDDGVNSKNVVPGNGKVTNELKQDWGLNDVWNDLILPRFERMNQLTQSSRFTAWNEQYQKFLPVIPLEFSKGFSKKRIDHRHHALDALVIACATKDHINLLNNKHANSPDRYDLKRKLMRFEKVSYTHPTSGEHITREVPKEFLKPWKHFTTDAKSSLEHIVVSFKQNLRVINKASNHYEKWVEKNGIKVKGRQEQQGVNWAIRKPMHKDTVSGLVKLKKRKTVSLSSALDQVASIVDKKFRKEVQRLQQNGWKKDKLLIHFKDLNYEWNEHTVSKVEVYYWETDLVASRVNLNDSFDETRILNTVTDTAIQKILLNHLELYKGRLDEKGKEVQPQTLAFSPEGIEEMNLNIKSYNNCKIHQPILKLRTYETKGNKFNVGALANKKTKFVEAAKGTNLFFAIYSDDNGKRSYDSIPFNEVVEHQKWRATLPTEQQKTIELIPTKAEKGKLLFYLSPNDLVYIPTENNMKLVSNININDEDKKNRIYKMVSCTGNECHFIQANIAYLVKYYDPKNKLGELGSLNKLETTIDSDALRIKESCIKIKVDRLGNILMSKVKANL